MKEFTYLVTDELGIHARPAGLLSKLAKSFPETIVTSVFLVLAVFGLRQSGVPFVLGIAAAVAAAISCITMFVVNLSIRNGHRNVDRILDSLR